MKISLFGKELFEAKKSLGIHVYNTAVDKLKKSDYLIDFYNDTGSSFEISDYIVASDINGNPTVVPIKGEKKKIQISPKGAYDLKLLNDESFQIKTDSAYIDEQIETFKEKLDMIKTKEFDMNRGTTEVGSILMRLENRKKYSEFKDFYEQFPYTKTAKINELTKTHDNLKIGEVSQFIADMPKEAVDIMKRYTEKTKALCDKKPVFYIIADKKDFKKSDSRRDPILLAQSPFGHFWQILGAWDEEMLFLEEL